MSDMFSDSQGSLFPAYGNHNSQTTGFTSPFNDLSSLSMPENMYLALRWCEYICAANGCYRAALERVSSYFITDLEFSSPLRSETLDEDEKNRYEDFFNDTLGMTSKLHSIALDYMIYGNVFISVLMPFKRFLFCPKCKQFEAPLETIYNNPKFAFQWSNFEWNAKCPLCGFSGPWRHSDRKGKNEDITIKSFNIHEMEILNDPVTEENAYIWKIPSELRRMIREGNLFHLSRAPYEVIQAIKHGNHLRFDKGFIYHLKEAPPSGIRARGWGISKVMYNWRDVYKLQMLNRAHEAILMDYVIPFRVITPKPGQGGADAANRDPVLNMNAGSFMSRIRGMIKERRRDPASWFTLPFPVEYNQMGAEANQLAPVELLNQGTEMLLNNLGVPTELFKGTLQLQTAPAALRLFEATWSPLIHNLNKVLEFIADKISETLQWEPITVKLMKVTHADDLNRQMAKLQLMMGGQLSNTTGMKSIGLEFKEEERKKHEEEKFKAEQDAKLQKEMDQMGMMQQLSSPSQPGALPGQPGSQGSAQDATASQQAQQPQQSQQAQGGVPMQQAAQSVVAQLPLGPNQSITPQELMARANTIAMQLLGMDASRRDSELVQLKKANPTMHDIVLARINDMRNQARSAGGALMMQQQFGKGQ